MDKRICSLETEYALVSNLLTSNLFARDELADLIEEVVFSRCKSVVCNSFGRRSRTRGRNGSLVQIREGRFVENGSRVYYDVGHFEWANPETLDPRSALLYDRAADLTLSEAVSQVEEELREDFPQAWIMMIKNNVDYSGVASYGCHENYSLNRYDRKHKDIFDRLVEDFAPFLVTRQIFCGSGRVGSRYPQPDEPVAFQLSQRAEFIEQLESANAREKRGILNLRDEPLGDAQLWRRLHLILGDANMSGFSTYLKVGTTSLVLGLVETGRVGGRWALRDPVQALHQVSRGRQATRLALQGGGGVTALEIQIGYWKLARQMASDLPPGHFAHQVITFWGQTLVDLERDSPRLARRLDWAIKERNLFQALLKDAETDWEELGYWDYVVDLTKSVPLPPGSQVDVHDWMQRHLDRSGFRRLKRYMRRNRLEWRHYGARRSLLSTLREIDLRYHDINPSRSLYVAIAQDVGEVEQIIEDPAEVAKAQSVPPEDTRARRRGQIIQQSAARHVNVEMDWDKVLLVESDEIFEMLDPFDSAQVDLSTMCVAENEKEIASQSASSKLPGIRIISVEDLD